MVVLLHASRRRSHSRSREQSRNRRRSESKESSKRTRHRSDSEENQHSSSRKRKQQVQQNYLNCNINVIIIKHCLVIVAVHVVSSSVFIVSWRLPLIWKLQIHCGTYSQNFNFTALCFIEYKLFLSSLCGIVNLKIILIVTCAVGNISVKFVRWHTTDNLRPNHTDTTPTPTPHQHRNFFQKVWCGCGLGEGCQLYATVNLNF